MATNYTTTPTEFDGTITVPQDGLDDVEVDTVLNPMKEIADGLSYTNDRVQLIDPRNSSNDLITFVPFSEVRAPGTEKWNLGSTLGSPEPNPRQNGVLGGPCHIYITPPFFPFGSPAIYLKSLSIDAQGRSFSSTARAGTTFTPVQYAIKRNNEAQTTTSITTIVAAFNDPAYALGLGSYEDIHNIDIDLVAYAIRADSFNHIFIEVQAETGSQAQAGYRIAKVVARWGVI